MVPATNNHVAFNMQTLSGVFANVFQTIAYLNTSGDYNYISVAQANTAFNQALSTVGVANNATLDLSDKAQRQTIFSVLENAITILEKNLGTDFSATTLTQLSATGNNSGGSGGGGSVPTCPSNPTVYPAGLGSYTGATIVKGSDGALYQCISNQVSPWCNSQSVAYYAPATGSAWSSAWALYNCK